MNLAKELDSNKLLEYRLYKKGGYIVGEWLIIIITIIGIFCLGLFTRSLLPSYMKEKGKNLATKEDVEEITKKTEEIKIEFQKEIAKFSNDIGFENEYSYKQYAQLYAKLYAIVTQSEYIRFFLNKYSDQGLSFEEAPFIELKKNQEKIQTQLFTGKVLSHEKIDIKDSLTDFNKKQLCEFIIENGEFASQRLLKLSVAYRFAHSNYSDSKSLEDGKMQAAFDDQEIELLRELIQTIIKDYNSLRKVIKLDYSENELESGLLDHEYFK